MLEAELGRPRSCWVVALCIVLGFFCGGLVGRSRGRSVGSHCAIALGDPRRVILGACFWRVDGG